MINKKKLEILKDIFGVCKKEGKQHLFYCPFCPEMHHKPKLSINIEKNKWKCWVCGRSSSDIKKLIQERGEFHHIREWNELCGTIDFSELQYLFHITNELPKEKKEKLTLPEEFKTLVTKDVSVEGKMARNYLFKRGITEKEIYLYKIGYATSGRFENRVIIPSFDDNGHLNYIIARSFNGDKRKYLYPSHIKHNEIIVNELYVNWNLPIFLTEGFFDAIKLGFNAIPILGNELSEKSKLFQKIIKHNCEVVLCLDNDANKKELEIAKKLLNYGINVKKMQIPNEFKDLGEMSREKVEEIKENGIFSLTNDSIMSYTLKRM